MTPLNRREFLNLFSASALATLIPKNLSRLLSQTERGPQLVLDQLPDFVQQILGLVPNTVIGKDGYLAIVNDLNGTKSTILQRRTDWNIENSKPYNELKTDRPWGIVLHWFGDKYPQQQDLEFYMRGFNGRRQIDDILVMTSAHFLVGGLPADSDPTSKAVGVVQTQKPNPEGSPYQAAHLSPLDYTANQEGKHYFISALNKLAFENPGLHFLLQDFYEKPRILPHMYTIAIEISGHSFEDPNFYPNPQKIANVLSVVWAIMKRYGISAKDIMGHFEIQLSKPDPGKKFLALIKYLTGIKALVENDDVMFTLVFGPFEKISTEYDPVQLYFRLIREYLLLTSYPLQVYEWDAWSKYLFASDKIQGINSTQFLAKTFYYPIQEPYSYPGNRFLEPENHEGVDFYPDWMDISDPGSTMNVHLIANGTCVYIGQSTGAHDRKLAVFRHRLESGSEIISFYSHLNETQSIRVGQRCPAGCIIGNILTSKNPPYGFLHFSLAYGPSWEIHFHKDPNMPLNAGPTWIQIYFLDPITYLKKVNAIPYDPLDMTRLRPR